MKTIPPINSPPLVSVIMPVYNEERYIVEAVRSVLNQTYENLEVVILDDGSTDNTLSILQNFARNDSRIKLITNNSNKGVYFSRNRCIEVAMGFYITVMGGDDIAHPDKISSQVSFLQKHASIDLCINNLTTVDLKGNVIGSLQYPTTDFGIKKSVFRQNPFPDVLLCKKSILDLEEFKYPIDKFSSSGDFYLWLKVGTKYTFGNVGKSLYAYRLLRDSVCHRDIRETEKNVFRIRYEALKMGYKPSVLDVFYNLLHFVSFLFLPSSFKFKLYYFLRSRNIL